MVNAIGWRTKRKIIVFESDDWGSIRMRSKADYEHLLSKGYDLHKCSYSRYDALESNEDVELLLNCLSKHKDDHGQTPVFTFNALVANPNYAAIKKANFNEYLFEPINDTYKKYKHSDKVIELCKKGVHERLLDIQLHGREHLNIQRWMRALKNSDDSLLEIFDREMYSVYRKGSILGRHNYLDAFGAKDQEALQCYTKILEDAVTMFHQIWGYNPSSFIAPTYAWPKEIEKKLAGLGINFIQGTHVQRAPKERHEDGIGRIYHYTGQKNSFGQYYTVRNAFFEPSSAPNTDWLGSCMNEISNAFFWGKPAIISSHRVNFIGRLDQQNRDQNLRLLDTLLKRILNKYPDVEFMGSNALGMALKEDQNV